MYLLDTNSVIYFFKGVGDIAKSNNPKKREKQLEQLLSDINIINFSHLQV